ncbi:MoaD/ThiS family protein [soil metagenome]
MKVTLQVFAIARQKLGRPAIEIDLTDPATVADLKRSLAEQYPSLAPLLPSLRIAVDSEYVQDDQLIPPGAELAAIPPVSGG